MRLSGSDLAGALDFLCAAGDLGGTDPFPREVLVLLAALIGCRYVSYRERDLTRGETTFAVSTPGDESSAGRRHTRTTLALPAPKRTSSDVVSTATPPSSASVTARCSTCSNRTCSTSAARTSRGAGRERTAGPRKTC